MGFSTTAKNTMLDSLTADRVRLHSGDPGAAGTSNALGAGLSTATFEAAASGARVLSSAVPVTGLAAAQSVTHFSVWNSTGSVYLGSGTITGDVSANSAGEYTLDAGSAFAII